MLAPKTKGKGGDLLEDVVDTYVGALQLEWKHMLTYAAVALVAAALWSLFVGRRRAQAPWAAERWLRLTVVLGLIGLGVYTALQRATVFDDAYISLRYAENFVAGKGLVFNEGEYVEGYTNYLWVMLVSLFLWLTPVEAPLIAVLGSLLAFASNLWVVWRISLKIAPPFHARAFAFPLAVALLAVQHTFTDYGTTGLETAFASLLVNLGLLALLGVGDVAGADPKRDAKYTFWAGLCWILATLTRPDHALFYAVGSGVVFVIWVRPAWRARKQGLRAIWQTGLLPMASYAAPFLLWVGHSLWKLHYYGELLPNTYYAKSAYMTYYSQGLVYALAFHLSSHLWLVVALLLLLWPWWSPSNVAGRRFALFCVPSLLLYEWYVIRVGGDFMEGRFYVTLIPLILLAAEQLIHELSHSRAHRKLLIARLRTPTDAPAPHTRNPLAIGALLSVALLATTTYGVRLIPERGSYWHLTDESTYYPISRWFPIEIDHANYRVGVLLGRVNDSLDAQGLPPEHRPVLASGAIGLLGYYSHMTLVDRLGLTDATVAHQEIKARGRPGHEKWATAEYLRKRKVHFRRGGGYTSWFKSNGSIRWGTGTGGRSWWITIYDRELMEAIRKADPDVWFQDFEVYIDKYIARLPSTDPKRARHEFAFFRLYYFDYNHDPERRQAFTTYFNWVKSGKKPAELLKEGRWDVYKQRGAEANKREQQLRNERAQRRRLEQQWTIPWRNPMMIRRYAATDASADEDSAAPKRPLGKSRSTPTGKEPAEAEADEPPPSGEDETDEGGDDVG